LKKRWLWLLFSVVLGLLIIAGGMLVYISPDEDLTMDYSPVQLEEKLADIIRNLKPEIILTESDINAIIKSYMNTQLHDQLVVEGAHFTVGDNRLYARLNVKAFDTIKAELNAVYAIEWQEPELKLVPVELKLKQLTLPSAWLKEITFPIYDANHSIISVERLSTSGNELVIKFKFNLFN